LGRVPSQAGGLRGAPGGGHGRGQQRHRQRGHRRPPAGDGLPWP